MAKGKAKGNGFLPKSIFALARRESSCRGSTEEPESHLLLVVGQNRYLQILDLGLPSSSLVSSARVKSIYLVLYSRSELSITYNLTVLLK